MDGLLGWLAGLPLEALYALIAAAAVVKGAVPMVPGDITTAFLAFLAARSGGGMLPTISAVTAGSVAGEMLLWYLGRHFGAAWLLARFDRLGLRGTGERMETAERRIEAAYRRFGWAALFVSRMVPGVRAVMPIAAGVLNIPVLEIMGIFTVASALWYGVIVWIAFRLGSDWVAVRDRLEAVLRDVGLGATALALLLAVLAWRWWRRRRPTR